MSDRLGMGDKDVEAAMPRSKQPSNSRRWPILLSALASGGAAVLVFGTGAGTVDRMVATTLMLHGDNLDGAWGGGTDLLPRHAASNKHWRQTAYRGGAAPPAPVAGPITGDETFWLGAASGFTGASGQIALGSRLTLSSPTATHGEVARNYEVIELRPLRDALPAQVVDASAPSDPARLMTLVICRELATDDAGAAPQLIRFLIETGPMGPEGAAAQHQPRAL